MSIATPMAPAAPNLDQTPSALSSRPHGLPPTQGPRRRRSKLLLVTIGVALVASVGAATWFMLGTIGPIPYKGPVWTVVKQQLKLTITERGSLEAAENNDIKCEVKAGNKGSGNATTIKWVIDDGTDVVKGDKLVELDDSALQDLKKAQEITVLQAEAARIQAEENQKVVESQNLSDIETAKIAIELAQLDLTKYREGEYEQSRKDIEGRLQLAKSDLEMWLDRSAWSQRMVKKGYLSKSQSEADQARLEGADIALKKVNEEMRVLEKYTKVRSETDLKSKLEEARRALDRVKVQANAKKVQAEADLLSKKSICDQEITKKSDYIREISLCTIRAPQAGLVVYFVPEQAKFGGGSQQSTIAQGEPVREGQKLMRIPDLSKMVANVKVHEAMLSALQDSMERNQGSPLPATIRVDAHPDKVYRGHVKNVANTASQQDFLSADVKAYLTMVTIDEAVEKLKPGMSAQVTILADQTKESVLVLPLQAVLGNISMGDKRKCYVVADDGSTHERDIVVGMSNESLVEIKSGLQEGEKVVMNTKAVLPADSKLKPAVPNRAFDGDNGKGGTGKATGKNKTGSKKRAEVVPPLPKGQTMLPLELGNARADATVSAPRDSQRRSGFVGEHLTMS